MFSPDPPMGSPYTAYTDGPGGSSQFQFQPQLQRPTPPGPQGVLAQLQQLLLQQGQHRQPMFGGGYGNSSPLPQGPGNGGGFLPPGPFGAQIGHQLPRMLAQQGHTAPFAFQGHAGMVSAASQLARLLAQQHTAGLRRYGGQ